MNLAFYLISDVGTIVGGGVSTALKLVMLAITMVCLAALHRLKKQHETLRQSQMRFQSLLDSMQDLVFIVGKDKVLREFYQYSSDKLYIPPEKFIGKHIREIGYPDEVYTILNEAYDKTLRTGEMSIATYQLPTPAGLCWFEMYISPIRNANGDISSLVGVVRDITEKKQAEHERMEMQTRMMQAGKLEAIGQLAAGIAHEINNPIQFVGDNTIFVQDSIHRILSTIQAMPSQINRLFSEPFDSAEVGKELQRMIDELDVDFLAAELPSSLADSQEGIRRVAKIVAALRDFSHPDGKEKEWTDLNFNIKSTVTITRSAWHPVAELKTELAPNLPLIRCHSGAINQVITNLIVNASDAIQESGGSAGKGEIVIRSSFDEEWAYIEVEDNGGGIPADVQDRIFEPFFTTKDIGKGTGQGLYISRVIVVKDHGGDMSFTTQPGIGTLFKVSLPKEGT